MVTNVVKITNIVFSLDAKKIINEIVSHATAELEKANKTSI